MLKFIEIFVMLQHRYECRILYSIVLLEEYCCWKSTVAIVTTALASGRQTAPSLFSVKGEEPWFVYTRPTTAECPIYLTFTFSKICIIGH